MRIGLGHKYGGLYYFHNDILYFGLTIISLIILHYNGITGWDILHYKSRVKYYPPSPLLLL